MQYILTPTGWTGLSENNENVAGDTPGGVNLSDEKQYHRESRVTMNVEGFNGDKCTISGAEVRGHPEEPHDSFKPRRATQVVTVTGSAPHHHERLLSALHHDEWINTGVQPDGSTRLEHPERDHIAYVRKIGPNTTHVTVHGGFSRKNPHNHLHRMMRSMANALRGS